MRLGLMRIVFFPALTIACLVACSSQPSVEPQTSTATPYASPPATSSTATSLPVTPTIAAQKLFDAWQAHDRDGALEVASEAAVRNLWASPPDGYAFSGTCESGHCSFNNGVHLVAFYLEVADTGNGYRVRSADLGTIESPVPSGG